MAKEGKPCLDPASQCTCLQTVSDSQGKRLECVPSRPGTVRTVKRDIVLMGVAGKNTSQGMSSYSGLQVSCAEDGATPVSWGCPAVPLGSRKPGAARPTSTFLRRTGASILAHGSYDNGRIRFTLGVVHSRTKVRSGCCVQQDQVHSGCCPFFGCLQFVAWVHPAVFQGRKVSFTSDGWCR